MKFYCCYETKQIMSKSAWKKYYVKEIDHVEYPDFNCWWTDMIRMNLLTEIHVKNIYEAKADKYAAERGITNYSVKGKRMFYNAIQPENYIAYMIAVNLHTLKEIKRKELKKWTKKKIENVL